MTAPALIKQSDLKRLAKMVRRDGVRAEVEVNGIVIRVFPDIQDNHKPSEVELPDDFAL
ncbi:hypothetical protein [Agrobacterium pusense]|uniref:hypothetical protein n=1 Tax=Agrobacterium pusense TaxID=648995 RepID=UPI002FDF13F2